jgi:lipoprotein-anchoring transpeptidase ErfK/SrfK
LRAIISVLIVLGLVVLLGFAIAGHIYNNNARHICKTASLLLEQKDYEGAIKAYEKIITSFSKSSSLIKAELGLAGAYVDSGRLTQARDIYKNILSRDLEFNVAKSISEKLGELNIKILFSPTKTADSIIYKVHDKDTLESIAKRYNTTASLIKRANNIKGFIKPGTDLKVVTGKLSIVVDKSQNTLTLKSSSDEAQAGEEVVKIYAVSTGANNSTPVGSFKIVNKIMDPPWFSNGKVILPQDPKNILGSRWMGFDIRSYGIHGTTDDASIGTQCTQGCVRMHNSDVEELYDIVPLGTEVTVVD